jgi:putative hydrolase
MAELNMSVASRLREAADLLAQQEANPFRVSAYRKAADTVANLDERISDVLSREGEDGLTELPHIGRSLAAAIREMVETGRWWQLERLRGEVSPEQLFQSLPGVGPELARHIHDHLDVDTLEGLEMAAHDGRLEDVPGIGEGRAVMIRSELADALGRTGRSSRGRDAQAEPEVFVLLDVDREYREKAKAGTLPTIAPRRFNPSGRRWLPLLHTERGDWHFTALYSNTARAHEQGTVGDWVVLYFHRAGQPEGQRTVVTERRGPLSGQRVVRGRETEQMGRG